MNNILLSKWSVLFIAISAFLIFIPSLKGPFILDDQNTIIYNELRTSPEKIESYSIVDHIRERTFSQWTFLVNEKLSPKVTPSYFRVVNYLLHLLNGFLIYLFVSLLWRKTLNNGQEHVAGLIAMMIFLVHPLQTQAVNYITQRMTLLSSGFSLLAMLSFLKIRTSPKPDTYAWVLRIGFILSIVLAVLSKPIAICIFPFILVLEVLIVRKKEAKAQWISIMLIFIFGIITLGSSIQGPIDTPRIGRLDYLLTQSIVSFKYFGLLLWPNDLSIDHFQPIWTEIAPFKLALSLAGHLSIILFAWLMRSKYSIISLGIALTYISFLPESGLIPLKDIMVEHRMYMPMIGIAIITSTITTPLHRRKWFLPILVLISLSLMLRTSIRNFDWSDKLTLWSTTLETNPSSSRAMYSIGHIYLLKGDTAEALSSFSKALDGNPRHVPSLAASALINTNQGNLSSAEKLLNRALELEPLDVVSLQNMGYLLESKNQLKESLKFYKRAVKFNKGTPDPHIDLGTAYLRLKRTDKAIEQFEKAINLGSESARLHNNLGFAYQILGDASLAKYHYLRALEIDSTYELSRQNLISLPDSTEE